MPCPSLGTSVSLLHQRFTSGLLQSPGLLNSLISDLAENIHACMVSGCCDELKLKGTANLLDIRIRGQKDVSGSRLILRDKCKFWHLCTTPPISSPHKIFLSQNPTTSQHWLYQTLVQRMAPYIKIAINQVGCIRRKIIRMAGAHRMWHAEWLEELLCTTQIRKS